LKTNFQILPLSCNSVPLTDDVLETPFSGIRIIHHNIQGLHSKLDTLTTWFNTCNRKNVVFCLSEIWTKPDGPPLHIPGYQLLFTPFHTRPAVKHLSYLPGSCIMISNGLIVDRNSVCYK